MAEVEVERLDALLWERLSRYMLHPGVKQGIYGRVVRTLLDRGQTIALFGGALRDLLAAKGEAAPRDLDIVVGSSVDGGLDALGGRTTTNRFGGQRVREGDCEIDLWPLSRTWAYRVLGVGAKDFVDLPRTTFLNVEALAIRLQPGVRRKLGPWDAMFYRAFLDRVVEINLEDNPNPLGCVVRSLVTASRLKFALGPRLLSYVCHHGRGVDLEEMTDFQWSHYGELLLPVDQLAAVRAALRDHMRTRSAAPFRFFTVHRDTYRGGLRRSWAAWSTPRGARSWATARDEVRGRSLKGEESSGRLGKSV